MKSVLPRMLLNISVIDEGLESKIAVPAWLRRAVAAPAQARAAGHGPIRVIGRRLQEITRSMVTSVTKAGETEPPACHAAILCAGATVIVTSDARERIALVELPIISRG